MSRSWGFVTSAWRLFLGSCSCSESAPADPTCVFWPRWFSAPTEENLMKAGASFTLHWTLCSDSSLILSRALPSLRACSLSKWIDCIIMCLLACSVLGQIQICLMFLIFKRYRMVWSTEVYILCSKYSITMHLFIGPISYQQTNRDLAFNAQSWNQWSLIRMHPLK